MNKITFTALAIAVFAGGYEHGKRQGAKPQAIEPNAQETLLKTASEQAVATNRGHTFYATATVYNMEASQCDSTPDICADGTKASYDKRILAVSRDQLQRWGGQVKYGDAVRVSGAGKHDGIWHVHDTMNRRYGATAPTFDNGVAGIVKPHALKPAKVDGVAHIDFLVPDRLGKWEGVKVEVIQ